MPNRKQVAILRRGTEAWNEWRRGHSWAKVQLGRANLSGLALSRADLRGADLSTADLHEADLSGANLYKAKLAGADLYTADLHGADMRGAELGTANLSRTNLGGANLMGADLANANLRGADLSGAELVGADLSDANLSGANLAKANLGTAHFRHADLRKANLSEAKITWANLAAADLSEANLEAADLSGADLSSTILGETLLSDTNLKNAAGLDLCGHSGPSVLDHRTLEQSGELPVAFLRGCGLADWQIEAAKLHQPNLTLSEITGIVNRVEELRSTRPIQTTLLFISYSQADAQFVQRLENHLNANGLLYWRDRHDAPAGFLESIVVREMRRASVLLVLSKNSVNAEWLQHQAQEARKLAKGGRNRLLCPIAVDHSWENASWSQVLRNQIRGQEVADFADWKESSEFDAKLNLVLGKLELFHRGEHG